MQVKAFITLLSQFEELLAFRNETDLIRDIRKFNESFTGQENKTVAKFVSLARANIDATSDEGNNPHLKLLKTYFERLRTLLLELKKKPAAEDVGRIVSLLDLAGNTSVENFVELVQKAVRAAPAPKQRPTSPIKTELVESYVDRLKSVSEINPQFDQVVGQLKTDRKVRMQEMLKIADMYVGYPTKAKTKKSALQSIVDRQALDSSYSAKEQEIERLQSW